MAEWDGIVPDDGASSARIFLIGEADAREEMRLRRHFVGPSGRTLFDRWWRDVGLRRADAYVTNVVPYRPMPSGKPEQLPHEELDAWVDALHAKIAAHDGPTGDGPTVIVPTGNVALRALTGKTGILKWRGSLLTYTDTRGRTHKVIPTVHPAATFREPWLERPCRADWARIAGDATFRELRLPEREFLIKPTLDDIAWYVGTVRREDVLTLDIETPRRATWTATVLKSGKAGKPKRVLGEPYIACVGFATDPAFAICVPTDETYWGSAKRTAQARAYVRELCESPNEKVLQNGLFDSWWLEREFAVRVRNYRWDLKAMSHCIDPSNAHDLAYMCSVELRHVYHKDECKDPDEISKYASDAEAFWTYNCWDCVTQRELYDVFHARLVERGLVQTYLRDYRNLHWPLHRLSMQGIGVDEGRRAEREAALLAEVAGIRAAVTEHAGMELYGKKALSPKKLGTYLYDVLRLPKQFKRNARGDAAVTTSEIVVRRLMQRYPAKLAGIGDLILRQRRTAQVLTFVREKRVDTDGRMRSSYGFSPETGRLSSTRAPNRRGSNAQNVDREIRDVFVPDDGCVFVEGDYSQGESRIVAALIYAITRDEAMLARARALPGTYDEHRELASVLFGVKRLADVTRAQRDIGKRTNHAVNYDMHGRTHSEQLSKDGYAYTPEECEVFIQQARGMKPGLDDWHRLTRIEIMRRRALTNAFGNTIYFKYERLCDELYRRGYAYKPQSGLARLMNLCGFGPLHRWIERERVPAAINAHLHDGVLVSVPQAWAYDVAAWMFAEMVRDVEWAPGVGVAIPVEVKVRARWGEREGDVPAQTFVTLPARKTFDSACAEVYNATGRAGAHAEVTHDAHTVRMR